MSKQEKIDNVKPVSKENWWVHKKSPLPVCKQPKASEPQGQAHGGAPAGASLVDAAER